VVPAKLLRGGETEFGINAPEDEGTWLPQFEQLHSLLKEYKKKLNYCSAFPGAGRCRHFVPISPLTPSQSMFYRAHFFDYCSSSLRPEAKRCENAVDYLSLLTDVKPKFAFDSSPLTSDFSSPILSGTTFGGYGSTFGFPVSSPLVTPNMNTLAFGLGVPVSSGFQVSGRNIDIPGFSERADRWIEKLEREPRTPMGDTDREPSKRTRDD